MGYTPLFSSLTTGTLCGKWPDIGVWPIILSLADRNGVVDVTPQYLAGVTGLPLADVVACMERFCGADPYSRTSDAGGARLELVDAHRDWGWRVINHYKYAEKARKQNWNEQHKETGDNAARMAKRKTGADRRSPALTGADRLSSSTSTSTSTLNQISVPAEPHSRKREPAVGQDVQTVFDHWRQVHGHPNAKLDDKRHRLIRDRLKSYAVADLCMSIAGYLNSPHHTGQNDRATVYTDIALLLRDNAHVDAGIKFHAEPPRTDLSALTRKNVAATAGWRPPEIVNAK